MQTWKRPAREAVRPRREEGRGHQLGTRVAGRMGSLEGTIVPQPPGGPTHPRLVLRLQMETINLDCVKPPSVWCLGTAGTGNSRKIDGCSGADGTER